MHQVNGWVIRATDRQTDEIAIGRLDTSYTTDSVYEVTAEQDSIRLRLVRTSSRTGRFPIDLDEPQWDAGFVAVENGVVRGIIATRREAWNGRLAIWHFYVDAAHRRRGIGRSLLERAIEASRQSGARTAWAETSNMNVPGIDAYRRLGFSLCGFDQTLYDGTRGEGQFAVYLSRSLG